MRQLFEKGRPARPAHLQGPIGDCTGVLTAPDAATGRLGRGGEREVGPGACLSVACSACKRRWDRLGGRRRAQSQELSLLHHRAVCCAPLHTQVPAARRLRPHIVLADHPHRPPCPPSPLSLRPWRRPPPPTPARLLLPLPRPLVWSSAPAGAPSASSGRSCGRQPSSRAVRPGRLRRGAAATGGRQRLRFPRPCTCALPPTNQSSAPPLLNPCSERGLQQRQRPPARLCAGAAARGPAQGCVGGRAAGGRAHEGTAPLRAMRCRPNSPLQPHHLRRPDQRVGASAPQLAARPSVWLARARPPMCPVPRRLAPLTVSCLAPAPQARARRCARAARRCCSSGTATRSTPSRRGASRRESV